MADKIVNRLTQQQIWAISRNIEENIALYTDARFEFISDEMNKIFDYKITPSNIEHIKRITGFQIGRPKAKNNSLPNNDDIKYIASLLQACDRWNEDARLISIINS